MKQLTGSECLDEFIKNKFPNGLVMKRYILKPIGRMPTEYLKSIKKNGEVVFTPRGNHL